MLKTGSRVSVIGLDGMGWQFFNRLLNEATMPYTKNIVYKSYNYTLKAPFPPMSYPSWLSIMSGVNPGKHGIFGFTFLDRTLWESKVFNAFHLEHPRIHEMLAMNKMKSIIINPMPGYPIIPLGGIYTICNVFVPRILYYPTTMKRYADLLLDKRGRGGNYIEKTVEELEKYLSIVEDTADAIDWNLYWIILRQPDETAHKSPRDIVKLTYGLKRIFRLVDKIVKTLASRSDMTILVSDHGLKMCRYGISVNDILLNHGFVHLKKEFKKEKKAMSKTFLIATKLIHKVPPLARFARDIFVKLSLKFHFKTYYREPDFKRSTAFMHSASSFGVYVKKKSIIQRVSNILSNHEGIKWVKRPDQLYQGPYLSRAPDLFIMPDIDHGFKLASSRIHGVEYVAMNEFEHHPEGILSIYCPEIDLAKTIKEVPAWTVTQLALVTLGVPVSNLSDDIEILRKIINTDIGIRRRNYIGKWRLLKNTLYLKRKMY